ncbi:MAG: M20/M25/M40 family metallo-hydrolase, partial [bacterium]
SNRSSVASAIQAIQERVASIGILAGAQVEELEGYPGWKPNLDSHVLKVAKEVHKELLGKEPEIKAVHAGLECGIIGEKYPGMDMVSLGPQIEFPHSPDERVRIDSVANFYKLMIVILERLAKDK